MLLENLPSLVFSLIVFSVVGVLSGVLVCMFGSMDFKPHLLMLVPVFLVTLLISFVSLVLILTSREQNMTYWYLLTFGLSAFLYYLVSLITAWICKKIWTMI